MAGGKASNVRNKAGKRSRVRGKTGNVRIKAGKRLRVRDEVIVLTGRDKGKTSTIERMLDDGRAIVAGINMVKKHRRPNPQINETGGIVEQESPIQMSNLALCRPDNGRAGRIRLTRDEDGKLLRVFKSDDSPVPTVARAEKK